ncbi:MAG: hypothetical protein K1X82_11820 [Bacteroidia bacterium]|nr:hypothetical protein [Bacteroidia bacterium]
MIKSLCLILFGFFLTFTSFCQNLTTDEKIEMMEAGRQSPMVIDSIIIGNYGFEELDQANRIKSYGISDKVLLLVLRLKAKLSNEEIVKLKEYETKGYSLSIISKSIAEKPKFQSQNNQHLKEKVVKESEPSNDDVKGRLDKNLETGKYEFVQMENTTGLSEARKLELAKSWANKLNAVKMDVSFPNRIQFSILKSLDDRFNFTNGQKMTNCSFECDVLFIITDNGYRLKFTNFFHSYNLPQNGGPTRNALEKIHTLPVGLIHEEIKRILLKNSNNLKKFIDSNSTDNGW